VKDGHCRARQSRGRSGQGRGKDKRSVSFCRVFSSSGNVPTLERSRGRTRQGRAERRMREM
jgi:hypothetical protein